jgi:cyclopropane fatty-acyl-phospholipid synthase-like methyltransferase
MKYVELLRSRPIAVETATANQQHYEVGTGVLQGMLGPRMKYSCALYESVGGGNEDGGKGVKGGLEEAEVRMLESYVERAGLRDGMRVLDLGYVLMSRAAYMRVDSCMRFPMLTCE